MTSSVRGRRTLYLAFESKLRLINRPYFKCYLPYFFALSLFENLLVNWMPSCCLWYYSWLKNQFNNNCSKKIINGYLKITSSVLLTFSQLSVLAVSFNWHIVWQNKNTWKCHYLNKDLNLEMSCFVRVFFVINFLSHILLSKTVLI